MIDSWTVFSTYVAVALSIFVPVFLLAYGFIKKKITVGKFMLGVLLFLALRMLILTPVAALLSATPVIGDLLSSDLFAALVSALLITLVDVFGKKLGYKFMLKEPVTATDVLSIAAGQGLAEVFLTVSWRTFNSMLMINVINDGSVYDLLADSYTSNEISDIVNEMTAIKGDAYIYLALCALFILLMHIITAFLVIQARHRKDQRYILFAIAMLLIFNGVMYAMILYSYWLTIAILIIFAAGIIYQAIKGNLLDINDTDKVITV